MAQADRGRIAGAIVLILLGIWFLAVQLVPGLSALALSERTWPLAVIGVGVVLAIIGLITWVPGMLVPACIVGGIGGLLYYNNLTGNWESWAYTWTLIPGFVGVGVFLSALMEGKLGAALSGGGWLILISLVMFAVFGSAFGNLGILGLYWPLLLVLLGVVLLAQGMLRRRAL